MTDRADGMMHEKNNFASRSENGFGDMLSPATTPPDPARDFLGFTQWVSGGGSGREEGEQAEEIAQGKQEMATIEQGERQKSQELEMENALWQAWHSACETGKNEMPDLDSALTYLSQTRERQLAALGNVDARLKNPDFRTRQMRDELRDIVVASLQAGENPARIIYDLAHGFGYGAGGGASGGTGAMATRFDHLGQAQRGARTLAASSGREAGNPLLLETVASLSEEEFARWYENNAHSFRQMFGG